MDGNIKKLKSKNVCRDLLSVRAIGASADAGADADFALIDF